MNNVIHCEDIFDKKLQLLRRTQKMNEVIAEFSRQYGAEMELLAKMAKESTQKEDISHV